MPKLNKKSALDIIVKAAKEYDAKLNDNHFLVVYQENEKYLINCIGFRDYNFLHMTGVKTRLSAQQFYNACINGKLSINQFEIDNGGRVAQKLQGLPYLPNLLFDKCMIGNFINSGIFIEADYFVGNTRVLISVAFRNGKTVDYPVSLYREDIRKLSKPTNKVLAVFKKKFNDTDYIDCIYVDENQDLSKMPLPSNVIIEITN